MNVKVFVDTNVLVYVRDASEPQKQKQAMDWMTHLWNTRTGRVSFQVLHEFYVNVTAKLAPGLDPQIAREDVRSLLAWRPVIMDAAVLEGAWLVQDRYQFSWWDALIISAAQVADCRYILTEDFQENQDMGSVKVINPFTKSPDYLNSLA